MHVEIMEKILGLLDRQTIQQSRNGILFMYNHETIIRTGITCKKVPL